MKDGSQPEPILEADIPSVPQSGTVINVSKEQRQQYYENTEKAKHIKEQWKNDNDIPKKKKSKGQPIYVLDSWYHRVMKEGGSKFYERKGVENLDEESHITSVDMSTGNVDIQTSLAEIYSEINNPLSKKNLSDFSLLSALRRELNEKPLDDRELNEKPLDDNGFYLIMEYANLHPVLLKEYFSIPSLALAIFSNKEYGFRIFEENAYELYESSESWLSQIHELLVLSPDVYQYIPPEHIGSILQGEVCRYSAIWGSWVMIVYQENEVEKQIPDLYSNCSSYQELLQLFLEITQEMTPNDFVARMQADIESFLAGVVQYEQFISESAKASELIDEAQGFLQECQYDTQKYLFEELLEWRVFWWELMQEWDDLVEESIPEYSSTLGHRFDIDVARRLP